VFSSIKTLLKRISAGCYIHRVRKCLVSEGCTIARVRKCLVFVGCTIARVRKFLISAGCTIARLWSFRRLHYSQGAKIHVRGKNEHLLDASRRRSFYGEVASKRFGSYSLS
jgi:hypothetical protein